MTGFRLFYISFVIILSNLNISITALGYLADFNNQNLHFLLIGLFIIYFLLIQIFNNFLNVI